MNDSATKLSSLTPQQRAVLELKLRRKQPVAVVPSIVRRQSSDVYPASFAQQRFWFLDQLGQGNSAYHIFRGIRLMGPLQETSLEKALNEVIRRHDILRTVFSLRDEKLYQVVKPYSKTVLPAEDLAALDDDIREAEAIRLATELANHPFDLAEGPLIRYHLLRLGEQEHILLLVLHHIIADGWSLELILREITQLYEWGCRGIQRHLPEPTVQYGDFSIWQRESLSGARLDAEVRYWRQRLSDAPSVIDLPLDFPRPPLQTSQGRRHLFSFSEEIKQAVKRLGQQEGVTAFMIFLAAFKVLLSRYTGQADIIVGTPSSGRDRLEIESTVGLFINMLALRTRLQDDLTFTDLLARVRETVLEAYSHQELPFDRLVEELHPARDLSYSPVFQTTFAYQALSRKIGFADLSPTPFKIEQVSSKYDLALFITETENGLNGILTYNAALLHPATAKRMMSHFGMVVKAVVSNPHLRVSEIPLMGLQEQDEILEEWRGETCGIDEDLCAHALFEARALETPDAVAVIHREISYTYREINERSNQLAHYLKGLGAGPEVLVALCLERSVDMIISLLATLKAGAAYLPLDPSFPKSRLEYMLSDSKVIATITTGKTNDLAGLFAMPSDMKLVRLDEDHDRISIHPRTSPAVKATGANLAYVIYTSGSTGNPKGVQITHRSLVNFLLSMQHQPGLEDQSRLLAITTLSFDIAALELLLPLSSGTSLVLADQKELFDGEALQGVVEQENVSEIQATPATWRILLESDWPGSMDLRLFCGGEAMSRELAEQLLPRCRELWNLYGPTETTIWSSLSRITDAREPISIGRPIHNTELYILDRNLDLSPIGVVGELHIGGAGLSRGYLGRPALTAQRFIPNPFGREKGLRLYKTGDLARYLPNGGIEILGRTDHQIKIRGFRIETGEIESLLTQHPAVSAAVVQAREGGGGEKRLVAYLTLKSNHSLSSTEGIQYLRERLPDYMVPGAIMVLDQFPMTLNGKIDRRALPDPPQKRAGIEQTLISPRNAVELQLQVIWQDLLNLQVIGVTESFFDVGGHSLLGLRLLQRVEKTFGQKIPLSAFFQRPTIRALADVLNREGRDKSFAPLVAIREKGTRRPMFCVHSIGGDVVRFFHLAQHLGDDQPIYGFQAPHPSELEGEVETIPVMAGRYLNLMKEMQPSGPYAIAGYSFGSIVAFEMAQQIVRSGEQVSILALLDGVSPLVQQAAAERSDAVTLAGFARDLARASGKEIDLRHEEIQRLSDEEGLQMIMQKLKDASLIESETEPEYFRRFVRGIRLRSQAVRNYKPVPYPGEINLFRASQLEKESAAAWRAAGIDLSDPARGWSELSVYPVKIHWIPGHHATLLNEPHVSQLAKVLLECVGQFSQPV